MFFYFSKLIDSKPIDLANFINNSIKYSWPLMINSLVLLFMNHYAKIVAFNQLPQNDMTILSFLQRICTLIVFIHVA